VSERPPTQSDTHTPTMKNEGVRVLVRFRPPREGAEPSEMSVTTSDDRTAVLRCVGARPHCHILCSHKHTTRQNIAFVPFRSSAGALTHRSMYASCRNPKHPDQLTSYQVDRVFGPASQQDEIFDGEVHANPPCTLSHPERRSPSVASHNSPQISSRPLTLTPPSHNLPTRAPSIDPPLRSSRHTWASLLPARTQRSLRTGQLDRAR